MQEQFIQGLSGIYKLSINNKVYIGQSRNLSARLSSHLQHLNNGTSHSPELQELVNQHGLAGLSVTILEQCTLDDLDTREAYYIKATGGECINRLNKKGVKRTHVSVPVTTRDRLQSLGYKSINEAILSLLDD